MKIVLFFVALVVAVAFAVNAQYKPVPHAAGSDEKKPFLTQEFVDQLEREHPNKGWKAGLNKGSTLTGKTLDEIKRLMGVKRNPAIKLPEKHVDVLDPSALPTNWTAMQQWSNCSSIGHILDQSACGSCWAFGSTEAASDRTCIWIGKPLELSEQQMNSCCTSCGDGCGGGDPGAAWQYYVQTGLVTQQCDPYTLPSCDHHLPNSTNPCPSNEYNTPKCVKKCNDSETWNTALHHGKTTYSITKGAAAMQTELYTKGPITTAFSVYADFLTYTGGVYVHKTGALLGVHAVKIVGYGVEANTPYWLVANSWNPDWGLQGFFKIIRGKNECGFEAEIWAGMPLN